MVVGGSVGTIVLVFFLLLLDSGVCMTFYCLIQGCVCVFIA